MVCGAVQWNASLACVSKQLGDCRELKPICVSVCLSVNSRLDLTGESLKFDKLTTFSLPEAPVENDVSLVEVSATTRILCAWLGGTVPFHHPHPPVSSPVQSSTILSSLGSEFTVTHLLPPHSTHDVKVTFSPKFDKLYRSLLIVRWVSCDSVVTVTGVRWQ